MKKLILTTLFTVSAVYADGTMIDDLVLKDMVGPFEEVEGQEVKYIIPLYGEDDIQSRVTFSPEYHDNSGSSTKQITDLFMDCQYDNGKFVKGALIRVGMGNNGYEEKVIAYLSQEACTPY